MPRPLVGTPSVKRLVGRSLGWQSTIGPRITETEGAPSTGVASPEDKYLLPIQIPSLVGVAAGTSTATGTLSALVQVEGTTAGTSSAVGNLINLVFAPIAGTASGTSTATGLLSARLPKASRSDAMGPPARIRTLQVPTPSTGADESVFFTSDGTGGLNQGEPYFVPPSSGVPVNLYQKPYVEDLAETLVFGNETGDDQILVLTNGDAIRSENSGAGDPGRNVVLAPGSVVDTNRGSLVWGYTFSSLQRGVSGLDLQYGRSLAVHRNSPGNDYAALVGGYKNGFVNTFSTASTLFAGKYNYFVNGSDNNSVLLGGAYQTSGSDDNTLTSQNNVLGGYFTVIDPFPTPLTVENSLIHARLSTVAGSARSVTIFGEFHLLNDPDGTRYTFIAGYQNQTIGSGPGGVHSGVIFGRLNDLGGFNDACSIFGRFCTVIQSSASHASGNIAEIYNSNYSFLHGGSIDNQYASPYSAAFGRAFKFNKHPHTFFIGTQNGFSGTENRVASTTDATPADMSFEPDFSSTFNLEILVVARQTGGTAGTVGDSAMWTIRACVRRFSSNVITLVGVPTGTGTPSAFADAGAATWDVSISLDLPNILFVLTVTGEANKDISWIARMDNSVVNPL